MDRLNLGLVYGFAKGRDPLDHYPGDWYTSLLEEERGPYHQGLQNMLLRGADQKPTLQWDTEIEHQQRVHPVY